MGTSITRLQKRVNDRRTLELTGSRDYVDRTTQMLSEATHIGVLRDAEDSYGSTRASVNYSGLLLNALMIHSRYLGEFKGTIIAEAALFALGNFNFVIDPVFTRVDALPLLKNPVLVAK